MSDTAEAEQREGGEVPLGTPEAFEDDDGEEEEEEAQDGGEMQRNAASASVGMARNVFARVWGRSAGGVGDEDDDDHGEGEGEPQMGEK